MDSDEAMTLIEELLEMPKDDMTNWEYDFLQNIKNRKNNLTPLQGDSLIRIYERHIS